MTTNTKTRPAPDDTTGAAEPEDLEVILPDLSEPVTLGGIQARVRRLKTREFAALLKIITTGLGGALSTIRVDLASPATAARDFGALLMLAVPNAIEEMINFLAVVCEPVDENDRPALAKYLRDNPDIEDLMVVVERVAEQERDEIRMLGGKAQSMWTRLGNWYGLTG